MSKFALNGFQYPSTRYSGSKRRLLDWIWENINDIEFSNVLDVFGGTGSVSLLFKKNGKTVFYNDLLKFNQIIGKAVVENSDTKVTDEEIDSVLTFNGKPGRTFIQDHFSGMYFLDRENVWLDNTIQKISQVSNEYKRAILMASLFQACLAKRPFNLFHRQNLYIRTAKVERTFGNKTTWETPFPKLMKRYASQYNNAVFSNKRQNKVIGGYHALDIPRKADLIYLDPPYFSRKSTQGTNYLCFYHFLEGLADYQNWETRVDSKTKVINVPDNEQLDAFAKKSKIIRSFEQLIAKFSDRRIVLSYQSDGFPSKDELVEMFKNSGKKVKVFEKEHRYALSVKKSKELLFITTN
jgi:adenine-specific DNA methylase